MWEGCRPEVQVFYYIIKVNMYSSGFPLPFIYLDYNFYQVFLAFAAVAHWSVHLSVAVHIGYFQKYEFSDAKDRRAAAAKVGQNHSKEKSLKDH